MHNHNLSRLWDQARKRREKATTKAPNTNPIWPERCVQCNGPAITKYTEMVSGEVSYWCNEDYDHWWMIRTYGKQIRDGEIESVTNLLVYPDVNEIDNQLLGWPD